MTLRRVPDPCASSRQRAVARELGTEVDALRSPSRRARRSRALPRVRAAADGRRAPVPPRARRRARAARAASSRSTASRAGTHGLPLQLLQLRLPPASPVRTRRLSASCIASTARSGRTAGSTTAPTRGSPRSTASSPTRRSSSRGTASTRTARSGSSSSTRSSIVNTVDPRVFHPPAEREPLAGRRVRVIATSWSDNPNKGADVLAWLDANLDRERYELTFVGRAHEVVRARPRARRRFRRRSVADELRRSDVYLAPSRNDPCSNALLEALACGLPAVYPRERRPPRARRRRRGSVRRARGGARGARPARRRARRAALRRSASPPLADVADRYLEVLARMSAATSFAAAPARIAARAGGACGARTRAWPDALAPLRGRRAQRLVGRRGRAHLEATAQRLGYDVAPSGVGALRASGSRCSSRATSRRCSRAGSTSSHRLGTAYLHGRPGTPGYPEFDVRSRRCAPAPDRFARDPGHARRDATSSSSPRASSPSASFTHPASGSTSSTSRSSTPSDASGRASGSRRPRGRLRRRARSRRTASAGATASSRSCQGPGRARRARSSAFAAEVAGAPRPADRPGARLRPARARAARRSRTGTCSRRIARELARAYRRARRLRRRVAAGGRPEGGARVDGRRRPARHDARRSGARSSSRRRERLLVDVDDAEALAGVARRVARRPRARSVARRGRARAPRSATRYERSTSVGRAPRRVRRSWKLRHRDESGRYALRAARAGRGCSLAARRARASRVFYGHDRVPGAGEPVAGGTAKFQRLASASRTTRPTSRSSTSARRGCRATSARCSGSRGGVDPARRQPERRRLSGLGGRAEPSAFNAPLRTVLVAGATTSSTRASSASARRTSSSAEPAGTWEVLHNAVDVERFTPADAAAGGRARASARRRPVPGLPARARARDARGAARRRARRAAARHGPARRSRSSRWSTRLGLRAASTFLGRYAQARGAGDVPPRAPPPAHEGQRPVPEPRDRGDGVRASGRLSAERRRARARRRRCGDRRPASRRRSSATSRRRRRRWPTRSTRVLADLPALRRRGQRRVRSSGSRSSPGSTVTPSCSQRLAPR